MASNNSNINIAVELRQATVKDLPQIITIENLVQATPWTLKVFEVSLFTDEFYQVAFEKQSGQIVGFLICSIFSPDADITNFGVHPDFQSLGIGSKLLDKLYDQLQTKKVEKVSLEVRVSNVRAINLYKKNNFVVVGLRKKYYRFGDSEKMEDGLTLSKFF